MKMKEKPKKENNERWLLTYSDLMNLLLILFIILYAMSKVDQTKYEQLSSSLSDALSSSKGALDGNNSILDGNGGASVIDIGTITGMTNSGDGNQNNVGNGNLNDNGNAAASSTPVPTQVAGSSGGDSQAGQDFPGSLVTEQDMAEFQQFVNSILDDMNMNAYIGTSMEERGLTITFKNDFFFDSGKDILSKDMKDSLSKLSRLINKIDNKVVVEGHTDNVPISSTNKFTSNWQLSAARAANVAQYLADEGYVVGARLSAIGYGEYQPVASNDTADGRGKNRRVDIVILFDPPKQ
ncbi:MAG TPA: flagellar motor protein MotB [Mobilitalea sp.]|nr:flagellar motor protein MotB [Mobilitalea sp.]